MLAMHSRYRVLAYDMLASPRKIRTYIFHLVSPGRLAKTFR